MSDSADSSPRITMTISSDDVIEAKIEPTKMPRRRPLIPYMGSRVWPLNREKIREFVRSFRFLWTHDRTFEFLTYMMVLVYLLFLRFLFTSARVDYVDFFYYTVQLFLSFALFIGYGWRFKRTKQPGRNTRALLFYMVLLASLNSVLKMGEERKARESVWKCISPELLIVFSALLTFSFRITDAKMRNTQQKKTIEDEGRMRRRIVAELRARSDGVYMPILVENEGDARREKKYLRKTAHLY